MMKHIGFDTHLRNFIALVSHAATIAYVLATEKKQFKNTQHITQKEVLKDWLPGTQE